LHAMPVWAAHLADFPHSDTGYAPKFARGTFHRWDALGAGRNGIGTAGAKHAAGRRR